MSVLQAGLLNQSSAQLIDGSLTVNGSTEYFTRTPPKSNKKIWTFSCWIRKERTDAYHQIFTAFASGANQSGIIFMNDDTLRIYSQGGLSMNVVTSARYRDLGWMNIVVAVDTTIASPTADRMKLFINGERVTDFGTGTYPAQDADTYVNSDIAHYVTANSPGSNTFFGQYTQAYFIDNQALDASYFGFTDGLTGTWRPKKFKFADPITTQYSGASTLTWDDSPIGSIYTLSNGNKTATAGGGGSGYPNADAWSIAIPANSTYAWTLDVTNGDTTGGWYFTDSQTASGTHADQRGGNSLGMRPGETHAGYYGTFASANGGSNGEDKISMPSMGMGPGFGRIDFVCYRPSSGTGKVWVKNNGSSAWVGGGDPSNTSSTASFIIPDGTTYFGITLYDRSSGDQIATFDGDGSIIQKAGSNTFYLPLDGNSPIGQDKSGFGNDYLANDFNNAATVEKATGARPILNTTQGGTQAGVGVFGSKENKYITTTSATNSGGKYVFENEGTQPTFSFIRGATYTFDYSASTGHPLRFATAADAAGSTQYTDGTSVSGNVISFTVPHNAPDTLYYYCTNHTGMGNSISVTTDETKADPYAWKCHFAAPMVGNNDDFCGDLNATATSRADTTSGTISKQGIGNYYNGSAQFDGSDDYITWGAAADWKFLSDGTTDYTLECWIKGTSTYGKSGRGYIMFNTSGAIGSGESGVGFWFNSSALLFHVSPNGTVQTVISHTYTLPPNKWIHCALVKEGNEIRAYLGGEKVAINSSYNTWTSNNPTAGALYAGKTTDNYYHNDGYMQDMRIYKIAKYNNNFVPPSTSPDILPDTPSGLAGKGKLDKITDGAVNIVKANTSYLDVAASSDFRLNGEFCIEYFVKLNDYSNDGVYPRTFVLDGATGDGGSNNIHLNVNPSTGVVLFWNGSGERISGTIPISGGWHHVALTREGVDTIRLFVDGKLSGNDTLSTDFNPNSGEPRPRLGGLITGSNGRVDGTFSNWRIVKGSAVYTSNFTPTTEPLTAITNTKLLCCQSTISAGKATVSPSIAGINNGVVWSDTCTISAGGALNTGKTLTFGFNGSTDGAFEGSSSGATVTVPVSATITTGKVRVYAAVTGSNPLVVLIKNGSTTVETINGANSGGQWYASSSYAGAITSLVISRTGRAPEFNAIEINDVVLTDPVSALGNNIAATTFNPFNTDIDTVRGRESGYATLNPLDPRGLSNSPTFSEGNLRINDSSSYDVVSTIGADSGRWYWEVEMIDVGTTICGIIDFDNNRSSQFSMTSPTVYYATTRMNGTREGNQSGGTNFTYTDGDTVAWALDVDNLKLYGYKNGVLMSTATITQSGVKWAPYVYGESTTDHRFNFGQKPFKYAPPDGFQPLNSSTVLPETVITRPDKYVGVKLYTGNGGTQSINVGLKPDFVWIKRRTPASDHQLYDSVRGANKGLSSEKAIAEWDYGNGLMSFDPKGFTLGALGGANASSQTHVAWTWKAGGNKNTFNVDDVGYASASDVNMSVGALNSVSYDQSAVWSNSFTSSNGFWSGQGATKAFDGQGNVSGTNNNGVLTFSPNLTIPANSTIEVKCSTQSNGYTVTVNGVANDFDDSNVFTVVNYDGSTTLSTITVANKGSSSGDLRGIKINGRLLVDNGVSVANVPSIAATGASVGTKQGFSIIKYEANLTEGATIAHGLTQKPDFAIFKNLDSTLGVNEVDWGVYHSVIGATKRLELNQTLAAAAFPGPFNDTEPTSSLFTFGGGSQGHSYLTNGPSGDDFIGYIWHNVPGLQKFGSYEGNESTNGPYVELGFRPAILLVKNADEAGNDWKIYDGTRNPHNVVTQVLYPNATSGEDANTGVDFLSNGFKWRDSGSAQNGAETIIYAAWAEAPAFNLYGGQSNAR